MMRSFWTPTLVAFLTVALATGCPSADDDDTVANDDDTVADDDDSVADDDDIGDDDDDSAIGDDDDSAIGDDDDSVLPPPTWVTEYAHTDPKELEDIDVVDLDGDGDLDLLTGSFSATSKVLWYRNLDVAGPGTGDGSQWGEVEIDYDSGAVRAVAADDIDGDGDIDVVAGGGPGIAWWSNDDLAGPGSGDGSTWSAGPTVAGNSGPRRDVALGDIDGDGDIDVLDLASTSSLRWHENVDIAGPGTGDGTSWTQTTIGSGSSMETAALADIDGDGDLDAVISSDSSSTPPSAWWSNDDIAGPGSGDGSSWTLVAISAQNGRADAIHVADVDDDGDLDVIEGGVGEVRWAENVDVAGPGTGDGSSWATHPAGSLTSIQVDADDVDGDGDIDIATVGVGSGLTWLLNDDVAGPGTGDGSSFTVSAATTVGEVGAVGDLDGDGDPDIACDGDGIDGLGWAENVDVAGPGTGDGGTWSEATVDLNLGWSERLHAGDIDGDLALDIVAPTGEGIAWFRQTATGWDAHALQNTSGYDMWEVRSGDVDGDGDQDIFGVMVIGTVAWWENLAGTGMTWAPHTIELNGIAGRLGDVDGDGDPDVVVVGNGQLRWWDNVDLAGPGTGDGSSWSVTAIDTTDTENIALLDVDGDGDLDVAGAWGSGNSVFWWENVDVAGPGTGDGSSWAPWTVGMVDLAHRVDGADIDGDGDLDLVTSARIDPSHPAFGEVSWWENVDVAGPGTGDGSSWVKGVIGTSFGQAAGVRAADLDGDGDIDVACAGSTEEELTYWANDDVAGPGTGDGSGWTEIVLVPDIAAPWGLHVDDLDGNGRPDIVGAGSRDLMVLWAY